MKFSIKEFFSKCNQIRSFRRIWSHLLRFLCSASRMSMLRWSCFYSTFCLNKYSVLPPCCFKWWVPSISKELVLHIGESFVKAFKHTIQWITSTHYFTFKSLWLFVLAWPSRTFFLTPRRNCFFASVCKTDVDFSLCLCSGWLLAFWRLSFF